MKQRLASTFTNFLEKRNWKIVKKGSGGALWQKEPECTILIPDEIDSDSFEFKGLVERIAKAEKLDPKVVSGALTEADFDEIRYRAISGDSEDDTIPFQEGRKLVDLAWTSLRNAGTTAQRRCANVKNYSSHSDMLFKRARMAHTEYGSYILPIILPLGVPDAIKSEGEDISLIQEKYVEPEARKITRTLSSAYLALSELIERAKEPDTDTLNNLVYAGASSQMIHAVCNFLDSPSEPSIDISIQWSPSYAAPSENNFRFDGDSEVVELLSITASHLKEMKHIERDSVVGTLAGLEFRDGESYGTVAIQGERYGRPSVIYAFMPSDQRDCAIYWLDTRATVVAMGQITSGRRGLTIERPSQIYSVTSFPEM